MSYPTLDGKQIVMTSLFPSGVQLVFAGAGDDPAAGRGAGVPFIQSLMSGNNVTTRWSWNDYVYMAGGWSAWDNAIVGDWCSMGITCPKTVMTPNMANTGNAMPDPAGSGKILPANGAGAYDINLVSATPVPNATGTGAWMWGVSAGNYQPPPTGKGTLFPCVASFDASVTWTYDLYPVDIQLGTFVNRFQMTGTRSHDLTLTDIKSQQILPHWQSWVTVNAAAGMRPANLNVSWSLSIARMATT